MKIAFKKYWLIYLFAISITPIHTYATAQIPDYLIYKGDTIPIFSNPLEQYFEKVGKRDLMGLGGNASTACWRGYTAFWELKNDSLFLLKITSCCKRCDIKNSNESITKIFGSNKVYADWFTGKIISPKGKLARREAMGYGSIYEEEIVFQLNQGRVQRTHIKSNKKIVEKAHAFQRNLELADKAIDTIFYHIKTTINWKQLDNSKHPCDDEYSLYFSKNGKIRKVNFTSFATNGQDRKQEKRHSFTERKCRRIIKESLQGLSLSYLKAESAFTISIDIFYNKENELELIKH